MPKRTLAAVVVLAVVVLAAGAGVWMEAAAQEDAAEPLETNTYDVHHLLYPPWQYEDIPDQKKAAEEELQDIISLVKAVIEPHLWEKPHAIRGRNDAIVVTHNRVVQKKVRKLLEQLIRTYLYSPLMRVHVRLVTLSEDALAKLREGKHLTTQVRGPLRMTGYIATTAEEKAALTALAGEPLYETKLAWRSRHLLEIVVGEDAGLALKSAKGEAVRSMHPAVVARIRPMMGSDGHIGVSVKATFTKLMGKPTPDFKPPLKQFKIDGTWIVPDGALFLTRGGTPDKPVPQEAAALIEVTSLERFRPE